MNEGAFSEISKAEITNSAATTASNEYLTRSIPSRLARLFGHGAMFTGAEAFTAVGAQLTPLAYIFNKLKGTIDFSAIAESAAASSPNLANIPDLATKIAASASNLSLAGSAIGLGALAVGSTIGWQGAKHAPLPEKLLYIGSKVAAPALVTVGALTQAPWAVPLAAGLSAGATALTIARRH